MNSKLLTVLIFQIILQEVFTYQPYLNSTIDYAASPMDLKNLIKLECELVLKLLQNLKDNNKSHVHKIDISSSTIKNYLEDFESTLLKDLGLSLSHFKRLAERNVIDFDSLGLDAAKHPFKTFRTIRRYVKQIPKLMEPSNNLRFKLLSSLKIKNIEPRDFKIILELSNVTKMHLSIHQMPTTSDLEMSMLSILRLNQVYKMSIKDFLQGKLGILETNCNLTAEHLLEIGLTANKHKFYSQAVDFFAISVWSSLSQEKATAATEAWELLQKAIKSHDDKIGGSIEVEDIQSDSGPLLFNDLLHNITHPNFKTRTPVTLKTLMIPFTNNNISSDDVRLQVIEQAYAFADLCRGNNIKKPSEISNLRCYLTSKSHPVFILSPLKVEVHNEDPLILQYYDVVSETEIENLKDEVKGEMRMSRTIKSVNEEAIDTNSGEQSRKRTSSNSWIEDYRNPKFKHLLKRIGRIINVSTEKETCSENTQIAAYSPGGHYVPHTDAVFEEQILDNLDPSEFLRGDRILTYMIYLSNVESGGSTVFPFLRTAILPQKGSAIVWHNYYPNGSIDRRTLHGGCSVVYGIKWIANKWIRSDDQMFIKKCKTSKDAVWELDL